MNSVVITGASEGFGLALANKFVVEKWQVFSIARHSCPNDKVISIISDLSKKEGIKKAINDVKTLCPNVNLLINNAGILYIEKLGNMSYENTDKLIKINLLAPMLLVSGLSQLILKNNADIVNVISTSAYKGRSSWSAYCSSKWGMRGFHECLKEEFDETSVRVMSINPPAFKSNHFKKAGIVADMKDFVSPNDLANILFMAVTTPKNIQVGEIIINKKKQYK